MVSKISFGLMGAFSFRAKENGFCLLLMPSWLLMTPLIMEDDACADRGYIDKNL
jgi:hypothetical protein